MIGFARDLRCQKYIALQRSWYDSLEKLLWFAKLSNHNVQLKIQHKSLRLNGKPRKIYPDNYQTLTKQFKLLFITKQVPIDNFFTNFLFQFVYKRNAPLSCSKVQWGFKERRCVFNTTYHLTLSRFDEEKEIRIVCSKMA